MILNVGQGGRQITKRQIEDICASYYSINNRKIHSKNIKTCILILSVCVSVCVLCVNTNCQIIGQCSNCNRKIEVSFVLQLPVIPKPHYLSITYKTWTCEHATDHLRGPAACKFKLSAALCVPGLAVESQRRGKFIFDFSQLRARMMSIICPRWRHKGSRYLSQGSGFNRNHVLLPRGRLAAAARIHCLWTCTTEHPFCNWGDKTECFGPRL